MKNSSTNNNKRGERLQKVLASKGIASRRQAEEWIKQQRLQVNGETARLGCVITPVDKVKLDNKLLRLNWRLESSEQPETKVLLYHKPVGEVCTRSDEKGRRTVFDNLPKIRNGRWVAVGRLDLNSSGLLLFTNNGELANKLLHPKNNISRVYAVRVLGEVTDKMLKNLLTGVLLDGKKAKFTKIRKSGGKGVNQWYYVTLMEGRNREVRRLWDSQGLKVSRLIRTKFGKMSLPKDLPTGKHIMLSEQVVQTLL